METRGRGHEIAPLGPSFQMGGDVKSKVRPCVPRASHPLARIAGGLIVTLGFVFPSVAQAGSMDFALERLVRNPDCRTESGGVVLSGGEVVPCIGDSLAFRRLVNAYATAIAPTAMYPARATGYGGFEIVLEGNYTTMDSGADYLRRGTRGSIDETSGNASTENESPAGLMQLYSVRLRKGFGFGLEVGSEFGVLTETSLISGGADVRIALLEGFRDGVAGFLPDIAGAGSVRTITGTPQAQITVAGVSGVLSKPITIAQSGQLTPWVGYQYLWVFGDSGIIDLTPATDPQQFCNYSGNNQPGGPPSPPLQPDRDGSPICNSNSLQAAADFNNSQVFIPARIDRQRLFFGMNYQFELFVIGGQFMMDVAPPKDHSVVVEGEFEHIDFSEDPQQYSFALQLGASF